MYFEITIALIAILTWDYGRRRLLTNQIEHSRLLQALHTYVGQLRQVETKFVEALSKTEQGITAALLKTEDSIDASAEYTRSVLAGFVSSATAIVRLSEEEKRQLQNKLSASRIRT